MSIRNTLYLALLVPFLACEEPIPPPVEEEKVSFYEVDGAWAESTLASLSLEDKINQLIVVESDKFDSNMLTLGGMVLNQPWEELIKASNLVKKAEIPQFFSSRNTDFGGMLMDNSMSQSNVFGASSETLDSLLSLERSLNQYLGINFHLGMSASDSLYQSFQMYRERDSLVKNNRLKANFTDTVVHVSGNWSMPVNDSIKQSTEQLVVNHATEQLVDSGMLSILFNEADLNRNEAKLCYRKSLKAKLDLEGLIVANCDTGQFSMRKAFDVGSDLIRLGRYDTLLINSFKKQLIKEIEEKTFNEAEIDNRVRKILLAKTWMRKHKDSLSVKDFEQKFYVPLKGMKRQLLKESMVLVSNSKKRIPINDLLGSDPCLIKYGRAHFGTILTQLNKYEKVVSKRVSKGNLNPNEFSRYGKTILVLHEKLDDQSEKDLVAMKKLDENGKLIIVNLDNSENLSYLKDMSTVVQMFGISKQTERKVAEAIYGGFGFCGVLPMSIAGYLAGYGETSLKTRLEYGIPEEGGIHADSLKAIRSIARQMIFSHTSPGCQVMAIKDGKVIYQEAFGHHTYDKHIPVTNNDVYDLASVTKITATTPAFMRFYEQGIFGLDDSLREHLPDSLPRVLKEKVHSITSLLERC